MVVSGLRGSALRSSDTNIESVNTQGSPVFPQQNGVFGSFGSGPLSNQGQAPQNQSGNNLAQFDAGFASVDGNKAQQSAFGLTNGFNLNGGMNSDVCMVKYNLKVEEVEFLKQTLNNTQQELNKFRGTIQNNGNNGQIQNLQNIINDLNAKLASSVPENAKQNMIKENEELKKTIGSLQGQVAALN